MPCMIPRMIWEGTLFFFSPPWSKPNDLKVEQLDPETMSNNFRLWLTSMPAKSFPVQVGTKNNQGYLNTRDRMFQTCLGSLNTRRTLYTSLRNVDSIVQNNNTALAIATQCSAPALVFQALLGIFEISVLPMAAWTFWSPLKNITEYCMTRCCRMVSRWRTNLLPDFEPTCAMPSVKRIPSDWSAFLGVQFIASFYMDSQLVNLCVIHFYQLLLYHANKTTYNIVNPSPSEKQCFWPRNHMYCWRLCAVIHMDP